MSIETKEDSPEKLEYAAGKPTKYFLFAAEFNLLVKTVESINFKPVGQFTIHKHPQNNDANEANVLQVNDVGFGFFSDGTFMPFGMYLGGDPNIVDSWNTSSMFTP
jgi:hypothetical protein